MTLSEARRTFAELMAQARSAPLTEHARKRLAQARQMLRRAKRPAMNPQDLNAEYLPRTTILKFLRTIKKYGNREQSTAASSFINRPHWTNDDLKTITRLFKDYEAAQGNPKLTRSKARLILHEGQVRGSRLTSRQRRFFGARASGYPRKNPTGKIQRIGKALEVRYHRSIGSKPGYYKHEIRSRKAGVYTIPPGWVYVSSNSVLITEGNPHV